MLQQIVEEHKNEDRPVHPDAVGPCVEYVASTMNDGKLFYKHPLFSTLYLGNA